jgi:hypothetical protein
MRGSSVKSGPGRAAAALAVVAHIGVGVLPYSASGLLAPLEGIVLLYTVWLALAVGGVALIRAGRPWWALAIAPAALAVWFAVMAAGGAILGWSA